MPVGLKRFYGKGNLHFITFSCCRRLPLLRTIRARNLFLKELGRVRQEYGFLLVGYVVMPNHVHLLISEPKKCTPSTVLQMLKQRVSKKMRKLGKASSRGQLRLQLPAGEEELRQFWQSRFYDFNVYSEGKTKEKLNYMHANPVIRGLVKHPKDWPWSSWSFYERGEAGLIAIDAIKKLSTFAKPKHPPSALLGFERVEHYLVSVDGGRKIIMEILSGPLASVAGRVDNTTKEKQRQKTHPQNPRVGHPQSTNKYEILVNKAACGA